MDSAIFTVTAETFYRDTRVSAVSERGEVISDLLQTVHTRTNQDMTRELLATEADGTRQKRSSPETLPTSGILKKRA